MKKINIRDLTLIIILILLSLSVTLLMTSRAYLSEVSESEQETSINFSTCSSINMSGGFDNSIIMENAYPVSDNIGLNTEPYEFTVSNNCGIKQEVSVYIVVNKETTIEASDIKIYYGTTEESKEIDILANYEVKNFGSEYINQYEEMSENDFYLAYYLGTYTLDENDIENLSLKLWISKESNISENDIFNATVLIGDANVIEGDLLSNVILLNSTGESSVDAAKASIEAKEIPNFSTITETNDGLFATEDDYGTSYYFRGAVDNNWVYFGGFYWRIVRIDGAGNVKLIYTGSTAPTESESVVMTGDGTNTLSSIQFNTAYNPSYYVGYMYTADEWRGYTTSSNIKNEIDTWYENNLIDYTDYLADVVYCSDRSSYTSTDGTVANTSYVTGNAQYYGAYIRNRITFKPTLVCPHIDDAFTVNDQMNGNAALTYPIAILTADEASFAGMPSDNVGSTKLNYLYTNQINWLISSYGGNYYGNLFNINSSGNLNYYNAVATYGVRVSVSIKSDITFLEGDGTYNNPYIIE